MGADTTAPEQEEQEESVISLNFYEATAINSTKKWQAQYQQVDAERFVPSTDYDTPEVR
jgi:hypothetical protein